MDSLLITLQLAIGNPGGTYKHNLEPPIDESSNNETARSADDNPTVDDQKLIIICS